ncbi:hypothetical protein [Lentzea sp. NPDC004782]
MAAAKAWGRGTRVRLVARNWILRPSRSCRRPALGGHGVTG